MGVDYRTVSLWRKRLREKLNGDKYLSRIIKRVEADLSIIKICNPFCPYMLSATLLNIPDHGFLPKVVPF